MDRQTRIDEMVKAAMDKFTSGPLYREAVQQQWESPLFDYATAVAYYQANAITRTHPNDPLHGFNVDAVLGAGANDKLANYDRATSYALTQWERQQRAECAHGAVVVRVSQDQIARLKAIAAAIHAALLEHGQDVTQP